MGAADPPSRRLPSARRRRVPACVPAHHAGTVRRDADANRAHSFRRGPSTGGPRRRRILADGSGEGDCHESYTRPYRCIVCAAHRRVLAVLGVDRCSPRGRSLGAQRCREHIVRRFDLDDLGAVLHPRLPSVLSRACAVRMDSKPTGSLDHRRPRIGRRRSRKLGRNALPWDDGRGPRAHRPGDGGDRPPCGPRTTRRTSKVEGISG